MKPLGRRAMSRRLTQSQSPNREGGPLIFMGTRLDVVLFLIMYDSDFESTTFCFTCTEVVQFYTQRLDGLIFRSDFELHETQMNSDSDR